MNYIFSALILLFTTAQMHAQHKPAYQLFNKKAKSSSYKKLIKKCTKADIVLFGELHNNPIGHWLQLELTRDLKESRSLMTGFEMLETDNQAAIDDYLSGKVDAAQLDTLARLWNNYKTDYAPIVDFAKAHQIKVIATNVPRRYAKIVFRKGIEELETLPQEDKQWIAPLPMSFDINLPGYKAMMDMGMGGHAGENFPKAQAIKDATMAHFILKNYQEGELFIHFNGSYHSDNYEGILWYLQQEQPNLKVVTISSVYQENIGALLEEHKGKADFILAVPERMTKTF